MDLPEWGVEGVLTKVDTGARTSAIHVENIEVEGGHAHFEVVVQRARGERPERTVRVRAPLVRTSRVRPSTGRLQRRPVVETVVRIGPIEKRIELSLVSRQHMLCRMLLGRMALGEDFLVDPARRFALSPPRRRTRARRAPGAEDGGGAR